jgi:LysR family transcriptional regulator, low CO2-responsive transcriptional regulator
MTLAQLRTFVVVADTGSVQAAAQQLYVTQSAVSASLAALQESMGTQLIRREGRGLTLTAAGVVYADYVRRVLGLLDQAGHAAAAQSDPERGTLRVAAVTTAGEQVLPRLLATFRDSHPEVGIQLEVGNRERVHALLDRYEVDLLLGGRPPSARQVDTLGVRPHELILVASALPVDGSDEQGLVEWVSGQTWLLRESGSGTRRASEDVIASLEMSRPARTLTVGSNAAIRESAIAGLGVTLISRDAVSRDLEDGRLVEVPLRGTPQPRDWHITANPGALSKTAQAFVAHVLTTGAFQRPDSGRTAQAGRRDPSRIHQDAARV